MIPNFEISNMNIFVVVYKILNELVKTQHEPRDLLPNVILGKQDADFEYDIFNSFFEARSAEKERTKVAKRPL